MDPSMRSRKYVKLVCVGAVTAAAALHLSGEQGIRVGTFLCPPVGARWPLLALTASFFFAAASSATGVPRRWSHQLVWSLALIGTTAVPLHLWRRSTVSTDAALPASIFRPSFREDVRERPDRVALFDLVGAKRRIPLYRLAGRSREIELVVSGFLYAPETGTYFLRWSSDGKVKLRIDETSLDASASMEAQLEEGLHHFELDYQSSDSDPYPFLDLSWDRPASVELLPLEYFVAGRAADLEPRALARKEYLSVASLVLMLVWWTIAGSAAVSAGAAGKLLLRKIGTAVGPKGARCGLRSRPFRRQWNAALVVGLLIIGILQLRYRPTDRDDPFFRTSSSEFMMQTVSIADLREQPIRSLWYLHIQPPMLDSIRAVIAQLVEARDEHQLVERVDSWLYLLWGLNYAVLGALVCLWLCYLTRPTFALVAALIFLLHPAPILYSTLLDSSLLSATGITWFYFELWKMNGGGGSVWRLSAATLVLFFTRSLFQWPFLFVASLALGMWRGPGRRMVALFTLAGLVMGLYTAKQYWLFGITYTSSFAGYNGCRSIGADVGWDFGPRRMLLPRFPPPSAAAVLSREKKVNGEYNFNQLRYLEISFYLMDRYLTALSEQPRQATLSAYQRNGSLYLRPSSEYGVNPILERLPWRGIYDRVFSGWTWVAAIALCGLWWLGRGNRKTRIARVGMFLPGAYIGIASVLFESGENMRFKFFIEPVVFVLLAATCHGVYREARSRWRHWR
jgi:hypothetical protein